MEKIEPKDINENVIRLIGDEWMLVTAGDREKFNMMTASWGSMGFLWNKPVVMVFVRPQRYTFEFSEKRDTFTLSFFDERYRRALNVCGSVSGRDTDKVKESGLTPYFTEAGFTERKIVDAQYGQKDFHKMYVAEIINAWVRK